MSATILHPARPTAPLGAIPFPTCAAAQLWTGLHLRDGRVRALIRT